MERLHAVRILTRVALALAGLSLAALADHCSLKVLLEFPKGKWGDLSVVVETSSGRVVRKNYEKNGVEFCDLGTAPVKIVIGGKCNQVVLDYVWLTWGKTRVVRAIYEPCIHGDGPPALGCEVLVMIRDRSGVPIPGAQFEMSHPVRYTGVSDKYGRVRTGIGFGKELEATIKKQGFQDQLLKFECTHAQPGLETDIFLNENP